MDQQTNRQDKGINQKISSSSKNLNSSKQTDAERTRSKQHDENIKSPNEEEKRIALVEYDGPIEHIFFHPLIVYPELAFDQDLMAKGYNDYFVTVKEFKRTLKQLYENNYILIDVHTIIEEKGENVFVKETLKLPEGKKPLILSIDDMNYYEYMRKNGNVHNLMIDKNGEISSYSKTPDGKEVVSRDNAIVPIFLDQFVDKHPDFSFKGAKGLIALTGYEGVLAIVPMIQIVQNLIREKMMRLK